MGLTREKESVLLEKMAVDLIIDDNGKKRKKSDIDFADDIIKLKNAKDQWAVIEKVLEHWVKSTPEESAALKVQLDDHREMLIDKEFGQTTGGKDMERRFSLIFPLRVQQVLRTIYAPEELEFDKKFFNEFAKRYPKFRVAEKS